MSEVDPHDFLAPLVEPRPRCVGLVSAIVANGDVAFGTFGASGHPEKILDQDALFDIGSITKVFTGLLLAEMVERGDVGLEDPLVRHLPDTSSVPSQGNREIRLVDLATHTSGLPRLPPNLTSHESFDPENPYGHFNVDLLLADLAATSLEGRIGETVKYSNFGFELLALALAHAAGTSYRDLLSERILRPLGLKDTEVWTEEHKGTRLVPGHNDMAEPVRFWRTPLPGDGGLVSTARDLARFVQANLGNEAVALREALTLARESRVAQGAGGSNGLGWAIADEKPGVRYHWHNGGTAGYGSFMAIEVDKGIGVVLLANSHHSPLMDSAGVKLLDRLCGVS